jgi:hypothetical protein
VCFCCCEVWGAAGHKRARACAAEAREASSLTCAVQVASTSAVTFSRHTAASAGGSCSCRVRMTELPLASAMDRLPV